jgi:hypothetical protein
VDGHAVTRTRAAWLAAAALVGAAGLALGDAARARPQGVPPYWRALPELLAAAEDAESPLLPYHPQAWGDPATGIFLMVGQVEFPGRDNGSTQRALHQSLHQSMEHALSDLGIEVEALDTSLDQITRFALRRGELSGQARLVSMTSPATPGNRAAPSSAILAVCFHDQREPALGARTCDRLMRQYEQPEPEEMYP